MLEAAIGQVFFVKRLLQALSRYQSVTINENINDVKSTIPYFLREKRKHIRLVQIQ